MNPDTLPRLMWFSSLASISSSSESESHSSSGLPARHYTGSFYSAATIGSSRSDSRVSFDADYYRRINSPRIRTYSPATVSCCRLIVISLISIPLVVVVFRTLTRSRDPPPTSHFRGLSLTFRLFLLTYTLFYHSFRYFQPFIIILQSFIITFK